MARRANGEGSVYKMSDGRWRAVITLGTGADGKRRRKSRIATRRADAVALLRQMQSESRTIHAGERRSPKLAEYLADWLAGIEDRSARNTTALYRRAIASHINPIIGGLRLDRLTPAQIAGLLSHWRAENVGARTQQVALAVLSHALQSAAETGQIASNPAAKVKPPATTPKEIDPFTADEVRRIFTAAKDDPLHYAPIVLLFSCGLRFGEMAGLDRKDVDLDAGTIRIGQQLTTDAATGGVILTATKTKRSRRLIDLPSVAREALAGHLGVLAALGLATDGLLFVGYRGGRMSNRNFTTRPWQRAMDRAHVRARPPHHARHTYATLALSAGVPVHVVSAVLGHSRASTTLDLYSHYLPAHQQTATKAIDGLFG